jgi:hypothetical protein
VTKEADGDTSDDEAMDVTPASDKALAVMSAQVRKKRKELDRNIEEKQAGDYRNVMLRGQRASKEIRAEKDNRDCVRGRTEYTKGVYEGDTNIYKAGEKMMKMTPAKDKEDFEASAKRSYAKRLAGVVLDTGVAKKGTTVPSVKSFKNTPVGNRMDNLEKQLSVMTAKSISKRATFHLTVLKQDGKYIDPTMTGSEAGKWSDVSGTLSRLLF